MPVANSGSGEGEERFAFDVMIFKKSYGSGSLPSFQIPRFRLTPTARETYLQY